MENHFSRNWPVWLVIGAMGFSFQWLSKSWNTKQGNLMNEEISYEMPRPAGFDPAYDLSNRKVIRQFERQASLENSGVEVLRKPMSPEQKKVADNKKKQTDKKKKETKKQVAKKPKLTTTVIAAENKNTSGESLSTKTTQSVGSGFNPANQVQNQNNNQDTPESETKLSPAQWLEILLSQPTEENAEKFYQAFKRNEVDSGSFYSISNQLLQDVNSTRQQIGLVILRKDFSVGSFVVLSNFYSEELPADLKAEVTATLAAYGSSSRFSILSQAVNVQSKKAQAQALTVIDNTLDNQPAAPANGVRGTVRDPNVPEYIQARQWQLLLPALQRLSASADASLAGKAQTLILEIQSLTTNQSKTILSRYAESSVN